MMVAMPQLIYLSCISREVRKFNGLRIVIRRGVQATGQFLK